MAFVKKAVGERCYLSPCSLDDAQQWTIWESDLDIAVPLGGEAYTTTSVDQQRERLREVASHHEHVFNIVHLETDEAMGRCMLFSVDHVNRHAMLGILLDRAHQGQGYGREAVRLLLDYAFCLLNLNSVMLGVMAFNEGALRCYRAVGFGEIGRRRQARIMAGVKHDAILMDILAEEYEPVYLTRHLPGAPALGDV